MSDAKATSADTAAETMAPPEDPFARPEFRRLPLNLTARLAAGSVSIETLRQLRPGFVVRLATPIGEPSWLLVDGAVVGAGELVEIKGRLAFRVTRLGGGDD